MGLQPREKAKREATQQAKEVRLRYQEQVRQGDACLLCVYANENNTS